MTKPLFIGMAFGIFGGNLFTNYLVYKHSWGQSAFTASIAMVLWVVFFGAYLKYFNKAEK